MNLKRNSQQRTTDSRLPSMGSVRVRARVTFQKMIRRAKTELLVAQTYEMTTWDPDEEPAKKKRKAEEGRRALKTQRE